MKPRLLILATVGAALGGCAAPGPRPPMGAAPYAPAPLPPPAAVAPAKPAPAAATPRKREKVAVLPIVDDHLFRAERAWLRELLASELAKRDPDLDVLPLSQVDKTLRPVSKGNGKRCAYPAPLLRRAQDQGWLATELGRNDGYQGKAPELWVTLEGKNGNNVTFTSVWNRSLDRMSRYRAAFSSLVQQPESGGLGVLGALSGQPRRKNELESHGLTLCESAALAGGGDLLASCAPQTQQLSSDAAALAKCFAGRDEDEQELLFEGKARCELAGLDDTSGPDGHLETCLCHALDKSTAVLGSTGRRTLELDYEAHDLAGKPRPHVQVIQASDNLFSKAAWRSLKHQEHGKTKYTSVRRLVVDNIDGLRTPLARCWVPSGSVVVADLSLGGDGSVESVKLRDIPGTRAASPCVEKALSHGEFNCTSDGKSASLRIAISWPRK